MSETKKAPAKKGRPRRSKKEIQALRDQMQEYIDNTPVPILSEFCAKLGKGREYIHKIPELADLKDQLLTKKEAALERGALDGDLNTTMTIFSLKQLGWSDKVEHHHDGEVRQTYVIEMPKTLSKEEWEKRRLEEAKKVGDSRDQ